MNQANSKVKGIATLIAIIFIICGFFYWYQIRKEVVKSTGDLGQVSLIAMKEDDLGVDTDTEFLLTVQNVADEKIVEDNLEISPTFKYKLEKEKGGKEYKIIPDEALKENTVYSFALDITGKKRAAYNWAFQSKGGFNVLNTLPGDKTSCVPIDTGIEITFPYGNIDLNKIKDCFTITPSVEGNFQMHNKTLIFMPKELKYSTIYTVILKKDLPLLNSSESLKQDYTFSFETDAEDSKQEEFYFDIFGDSTQFKPEEAPAYAAYFYNQANIPDLEISLYSYENAEKYMDALKKKDKIPSWSYEAKKNYHEDLTNLKKIKDFKTEFLTIDEHEHYVIFPENLPKGYYAAEIKAGKCVRQVWFEVTDFSAYLAKSEDTSLLWVNNLNKKEPCRNFKANLYDNKVALKGDAKGAVKIETKKLKNFNDYILVTQDDNELVVPFSLESLQNGENIEDYWKYLYLDRELYKPGDIVHFWGVLKACQNKKLPQEKLTINLEVPYSEQEPIVSHPIKLDKDNFTGEIKLPVLKPDHYVLSLKMGDTELVSRWFKVETYQKASYKLSLIPEKRAIFNGESTNLLAKASFFEGTSVPNLKLEYDGAEFVTNEVGEANIPCTTSESYNFDNYTSSYQRVKVKSPEYGEISANAIVHIFNGNCKVSSSVQKRKDKFTVNMKVNRVDLTEVNQGKPMIPENYLKEPLKDKLIECKIYKNVWKKTKIGEKYNFVSKKVEEVCEYENDIECVSEFELRTDKDGKVAYSRNLDSNNSYYMEMCVKDEQGRIDKDRVDLSYFDGCNADGWKYYHLENANEEKESYLPGEKVNFNFMENGAKVKNQKDAFLFFKGQKNIDDYEVSSKSGYSFDFNEKDIPNVNLYGVYFDGETYQTTYDERIDFNYNSKELKVKIKADKDKYEPSDKVKLNVIVTDKDNNPVAATVNLNLVDEAIYNLQDQHVDLLKDLYTKYFYINLKTYTSHFHPDREYGAECGGEGGSERDIFQDTVLFKTLKTDNKGRASIEFTLPDNLTSWRVTYHALDKDLRAGSGAELLGVSLPFFLELNKGDVYLLGDSPIFTVRSYGEKLKANTNVAYELKLTTPEGKKIVQKKEGLSFKACDFQMPKLVKGKYKVSIEAKCGDYVDKVGKEFNVVSSFLQKTTNTKRLLKEGLKLDKEGVEPLELTFSDYEKGQYLRGLYDLGYSYGSRLEQVLSRIEAKNLLQQYFSEKENYFTLEEKDKLINYQKIDGGISIFPYAESNLALTALVAASHSPYFDKKAMKNYFYDVFEESDENYDESFALWGLASLSEPVLNEINLQLKAEKLASDTKINLALASLEIGNGANALKVYEELIKEYGEDLGPTLRVKVGENQDEIIKATSKMALLAASLNQPEKNKLYQYLLENEGKEILNSLEKVEILKYGLKYMDPTPVSFTYELNGEKVQKTLKENEIFKMTLLPAEITKIKFSNIKGKIAVIDSVTKPFKTKDIKKDQDLMIERSYLVDGNSTNNFSRNDEIMVTIYYEIRDKAPEGVYEIQDVLPAGLSIVKKPDEYNLPDDWYLSYPTSINGQKISFSVWNRQGEIRYFARVVSPGEFKAEPVLLENINNDKINSLGKENRVIIK